MDAEEFYPLPDEDEEVDEEAAEADSPVESSPPLAGAAAPAKRTAALLSSKSPERGNYVVRNARGDKAAIANHTRRIPVATCP
jgi:hypothetical protein